jgi:hypothetical protein
VYTKKICTTGNTNRAPYVSVEDEVFHSETYLMRPYRGKLPDNIANRIYSYRLYRVRRIVENAFGILTKTS